MTTHDTLRAAILARVEELGLNPFRAARVAALPPQTVRDYLVAGRDLNTERALALAGALGLVVTIRPDPGYTPPGSPPETREPQGKIDDSRKSVKRGRGRG